MKPINQLPIKAELTAPTKIHVTSFVWLTRNPMQTPGSTACPRLSPNSDIFLSTTKLPSNPQLKPSNNIPARTMRTEGADSDQNRRNCEKVVEGGAAKSEESARSSSREQDGNMVA